MSSRTSHERCFLVFGTLDSNALRVQVTSFSKKKKKKGPKAQNINEGKTTMKGLIETKVHPSFILGTNMILIILVSSDFSKREKDLTMVKRGMEHSQKKKKKTFLAQGKRRRK